MDYTFCPDRKIKLIFLKQECIKERNASYSGGCGDLWLQFILGAFQHAMNILGEKKNTIQFIIPKLLLGT